MRHKKMQLGIGTIGVVVEIKGRKEYGASSARRFPSTKVLTGPQFVKHCRPQFAEQPVKATEIRRG